MSLNGGTKSGKRKDRIKNEEVIYDDWARKSKIKGTMA